MTSSRTRREEIVLLATGGKANVEDLASQFDVTASTIRRDLATLDAQGRLVRTYGGAVSLVSHAETSLRERMGEAFEEKRAIARWAADQVRPGEILLLDAGSTVAAVAHELRSANDLRVATVGLTVLEELADAEGIRVDCLGGRLRPLSQSFLGPLTEAALERMTFDRAFLGADAVTAGRGICEADLEQTRLKELMARRAGTIYVLAHGAKLGKKPFHAWARLALPWVLVTDRSASEEEINAFIAEGVTVVVVDGDRV
ncbi:DeoR/GlpR family DNA-binding transcription regulator [Cryobacterium sp. TMT4-10]|uniref:DeoR/GlpR family DNA-binding transcription regulator n=1 Tax=Cryobacterium sp. TMT4-10 TaxID=1259256 RepID=UPI001069EE96|nr:DeoR/GlpR family DNA-binding transcription regulator [Cryobacterium sp. TMT4-10]TFD12137.1 DeoR/GlpR transcriptional regulator [Cryobacterium sp. TMT4-10]